MITGNMHFDAFGYPRAVFETPFETLGSFLEVDVQGSPTYCRQLIHRCENIMNGCSTETDGVGNAHRLVIRKDDVKITCVFSDAFQPCHLTTSEFKQVLIAWLQMIEPELAG